MGQSLLKNHNVEKEHYLTGGFKNLWKIYKGSSKTRPGMASVFVFEKKNLDKHSKEEREEILNILRKEANSLIKFKHPNLLSLVEQLMEDKSTIVFATEFVTNSLASLLDSSGLSKLEVKLVIAQICSVLTFLHEDAKVIHTTL